MSTADISNQAYPLTLYYDGVCPVCNLEMDNLKARNQDGMLRFVDISVPFFDPAPLGVSLKALNELIHARQADGTLVVGVEVFRLAYGAVGLGRWFAPTALPVLKPLADAAYAVFARNRYGFSRATMPVLEWLRRAPLDGGVAAEFVDADGRAVANGGDASLAGLLAATVVAMTRPTTPEPA